MRQTKACARSAWIVALALFTSAARVDASAGLINVASADAHSITDASARLGETAVPIRLDKPIPGNVRLILYQPRAGLTDAQAKLLGDAVQRGVALLFALDERAGKDAFNVSFMLPTTAWAWRQKEPGPITAAEFDPDIFPGEDLSDVKGFSVPYTHQIRPFHAVERGQARYNQFAHSKLFSVVDKNDFLPADSNEWTRPLIDRDWKIRVRAEGALGLPLLITGQYGRGRVAVLASGFETLDSSPQGATLSADALKWLLAGEKPAPVESVSLPAPMVTVDREHHALSVEVTNPTGSMLRATVIGRVLTWEPAMVGDVETPVEVPAGGKTTVTLAIPVAGDTSYTAESERDAYQVRLGLISGDGSSLMTSEQLVRADFSPPLSMSLSTDDVRSYEWPFAPAPVLDAASRMGDRINEYAYKPGQTLHAELALDNGASNIASMAKAADETTPDNPSIIALNDGFAASERNLDSTLDFYGAWHGKKGVDNVVSLTFPKPVLISGVVLIGAASEFRHLDRGNPAAVIIEADGKEVASEMSLSDRMLSDKGKVRLDFAPVTATVLRLKLPWKSASLNLPTLGDVQVWGTTAPAFPPAMQGTASFAIHDLITDATTSIGDEPVSIDPGGHLVLHEEMPLPRTDGKPAFYQIEARMGAQHAQTSVMSIDPPRVLSSMASLKGKAVEEGFIVTRGFFNIFHIGTGTQEPPPGWAGPDDLVWAYAHNMKENGERSNYIAGKLYVTENDMRHYSTCWRHFPSGNAFYQVAAPLLVDTYSKMRGWKDADTAVLGHSDRWDAGPPVEEMFCWPEFIAFDQWLRAKHMGNITGRTKTEITQEINSKYSGPWYAYHLEQYENSVSTLRDAFAAVGKRVIITSQGCPLVPPAFSQAICAVIRGNSDDCTWGMERDDVIVTTGKQMGALAFNPYLAMSTLLQWQYNCATINNPQWHVPAGTTEPSRRMIFDRAFRGSLRLDGSFGSMHSYGYNTNAGDSFTLTENDYRDWKHVFDLHTLVMPDAPLGAGLVIANSYLNDPRYARFSGGSPIGAAESHIVSTAVGTLQRAGLSIPFSANALCLEHWQGSAPLIVLNLQKFEDPELAMLRSTLARGVRVAAFCQSSDPLSPAAAELFGVDVHGDAADGTVVGNVGGHSVVAKANALFVPLNGETMAQQDVDALTPLLLDRLNMPVRFDAGSAGYAFVSNGRKFIVVEDWREQARILHLRLSAGDSREITAIGVNDGNRLSTHRDGSDWVIDVPTRPGDGNLICVTEN